MRTILIGGVLALLLVGCGGGGGGGAAPPPPAAAAPVVPPPAAAPAPTPPPPPPPPGPPSAEWTAFVSTTLEALFQLDPVFAAYQGRHEFDGRLPDWSEAGLRRIGDFWRLTIDRANAIAALNSDQEFERAYLLQLARGQLFFLEDADVPHRNPTFYINGGLDPDMYLTRDYADAATRMRAVIALLQGVPAASVHIRANLRLPLPATFLNRAITAFRGYAGYYVNDVRTAFAGVNDAALQQQLAAASAAASQSMTELAQWLEANRPSGTQDFALGADRFLRMLAASEGVTTTIAELQTAGVAQLRRDQNALAAACAQFAPGATIGGCVGAMASRQPADGIFAGAQRQIAELRQFIAAQDLLTIPSEGTLAVRESPPFSPVIYFTPPGPFDTNVTASYYIPSNVPRGEADLLFVTLHEVMPGHFVQFLRSNRTPSLVGRLFIGYSFAEGWAHYAEEMMWDAGLRGTPEAHIGQLANSLLRDCRFLAAIGMHAQGMTLAQAEALFQQECFQGVGGARAGAERGTYDPLYLSYTLGKLMIRRLRDDWTGLRGGRTAWKAFHDEFLSYGGPPIPLVRQRMMQEATPRTLF